jgi:hypothetical protein
MAELWALLISAQDNPSGIPDSLLDMKREEIIKKKVNTKKKNFLQFSFTLVVTGKRRKRARKQRQGTGKGPRTREIGQGEEIQG